MVPYRWAKSYLCIHFSTKQIKRYGALSMGKSHTFEPTFEPTLLQKYIQHYGALSMGKVIPLRSRGLKDRRPSKLRLRPPCLGSSKPGLPAQIWGFVLRTSRTNWQNHNPLSICHQIEFVSCQRLFQGFAYRGSFQSIGNDCKNNAQ